MKKLNLFLLILVLVLGVFILVKQFLPSGSNEPDVPSEVTQPVDDTREVGLSEAKSPEETKISETELHKHVKNKRYLDNTYMALEYSKVNNAQLADTLKAYMDDNTKMKPEDVSALIEIHEKTFLNRYLKVFVSAPDAEMQELNSEMRRIFYQMKLGFDSLRKYGAIPVAPAPAVGEDGQPIDPATVDPNAAPAEGGEGTAPATTPAYTGPAEPKYDLNDIRIGLQQLEQVQPLVEDALAKLGKEDIKIEIKWVEAGISESDLLEVMDKTNIANPELSEDTSFGEEDSETREETLSKIEDSLSDTQNNE